jgi:succinate dehydrogenase / fumarate reductase cytochrome b subunit
VARRATAKRSDDYGTMYRGREGQWSWIMHRVTGVIIILFLFAHVVDTAVIGWGPAAYNRVVAVYRNPVVGVLEWALVGAVIYHALNGVRIMIIDFWPRATRWYRPLLYGTVGVFVAGMIPISIIMWYRIVQEIVR